MSNGSYHPNEALALAIVRAWSDSGYKTQLLSFHTDAAQTSYANPDYPSTSTALAQFDVHIRHPIVLSETQYQDVTTRSIQLPSKAVFVLPDALHTTGSFATARAAMAMHPLGM